MSCHTVYVNNLNEKVGVEELKKAIAHVFKQFGTVLEVQANKAIKRRGQAWVVFEEVNSAEKCIKDMQGFNFYDKPMRLAFAKSESDVTAKRNGTFVERPPKPGLKAYLKKKNKAKRKKGTMSNRMDTDSKEPKQANGVKRPREDSTAPIPSSANPHFGAPPGPSTAHAVQAMPAAGVSMFPPVQQVAGPNRILFVENLSPECKKSTMDAEFSKYQGFQQVRLISARCVAFVDFETDFHANLAMQGLREKEIDGSKMKISFAKRR